MLRLTKSGQIKLKSHQTELKAQDIEDSIKSTPPGEWNILCSSSSDEAWVCYINSTINEKFSCVQVVASGSLGEFANFTPEQFIENKLVESYNRRQKFFGYESGGRVFYGIKDGLPGLIIDLFSNACIIQINTAGVDKYRELISSTISRLTNTKSYFLDNPKYRERESLPTFEVEKLPAICIFENGLEYALSSEIIQKVGFYYDHRENRLQLSQLISRLKLPPANGVDLFCYAGAWGLNAIKAGLKSMIFVDQGDFDQAIQESIARNKLDSDFEFHRCDVFKFLDSAITAGNKYDLVISDPPAFAKSMLQKNQALEGYSKLHRKIMKIASPGAVLALSSCTHYVGHEEFQKNILDAAHKEGKSIQLLYCGMQGWDHPIESLNDRSNYIKSYFYILE